MFKLWFLKDEQASSLSGTKLLFPMLNAILLYMVQILFLLSSFVFAGSTLILLIGWISFVCQNSCDFALLLQSLVRYGVPITFYVLCFVACMTLGSLFKLARIDVEQTKDYNVIEAEALAFNSPTFQITVFPFCVQPSGTFSSLTPSGNLSLTTNYNMQFNLFGALSSFVAVVVAIISLFMQR